MTTVRSSVRLFVLVAVFICLSIVNVAAAAGDDATISSINKVKSMMNDNKDDNAWYSACQSSTHQSDASSSSSFRLPAHPSSRDVLSSSSSFTLVTGYNPDCASYGYFNDSIDATGWSYLHIATNPSMSSSMQSFAAGWLEGMITTNRIYQAYVSAYATTFVNGTCPDRAYSWVQKQNDFIQNNMNAQPNDDYWNQVGFVYTQISGLYAGYGVAAAKMNLPIIDERDMLMYNLQAEAGDILLSTDDSPSASDASTAAVDVDGSTSTTTSAIDDIDADDAAPRRNPGHCSALIRLSPDLQDLFSSHTTWSTYTSMLRSYKYHDLPLLSSASGGVHFSSYPGLLHSLDDFYQTSSGLVVIETTNDQANATLYGLVVHRSVPTFVRAIVANRFTSSGQGWATTYALHNSGTYNNQWMVLDYKRFTPGQTPTSDLLWIASQAPGIVLTQDVTSVLVAQSYWASYNIPFFSSMWKLLNYQGEVDAAGPNPPYDGEYLYSYAHSFRALAMAREAPRVRSVADMQRVMQQNYYLTDPLSRGSAQLAICSRFDLSDGPLDDQSAFGSIDAKVTSYRMMQDGNMHVLAKSGPTVEDLPPFRWSTSPFASTSVYLGQPDEFNFAWQSYSVSPLPSSSSSSLSTTDTIVVATE